MAMLFSVMSWNVEHFKEDPARVGRVVEFMKQQNPDVFGLYEVEGSMVFGQLVTINKGGPNHCLLYFEIHS